MIHVQMLSVFGPCELILSLTTIDRGIQDVFLASKATPSQFEYSTRGKTGKTVGPVPDRNGRDSSPSWAKGVESVRAPSVPILMFGNPFGMSYQGS